MALANAGNLAPYLNISRKPAQAIAEAAKHFGKEDDITVLSITLVASDPMGSDRLVPIVVVSKISMR